MMDDFFGNLMGKVITKIGWLSAVMLLFLSAGILAQVLNGFSGTMAGQEFRPSSKFFALQVFCEAKVEGGKDALGPPDGLFAEILPGGQLSVLMENTLFPSPIVGYGENATCLDSGTVVGKGNEEFGLEGWLTWRDTQGEQHHEWILLGPSATGFCFVLSGLDIDFFKDNAGVEIIRITNPGTKSLFVDAVIGNRWILSTIASIPSLAKPLYEVILGNNRIFENSAISPNLGGLWLGTAIDS